MNFDVQGHPCDGLGRYVFFCVINGVGVAAGDVGLALSLEAAVDRSFALDNPMAIESFRLTQTPPIG